MISINKKFILLFAMISIYSLSEAQTITIPQEVAQTQDVSLFLLVQDHNGERRGGVFEIDADEPIKKINNEDFQSIDDATLSLEGEEVAIFDFYDISEINQEIIYFEIAAEVLVIKALIINNSLLAEQFISVVNVPVEEDDSEEKAFSFDDDLFGDVSGQQEAISISGTKPPKHFSAYQMYSLVKIGILMQYENAKRLCKKLNNNAKRLARWFDGSSFQA